MANELPIVDPGRTEYGFQRTKCGCTDCSQYCRFMPGYLAPGDLDRMHMAIGPDLTIVEFAEKYLNASPGAKVGIAVGGGMVVTRVPTLVPAATINGACVFLKDDKCSIHEVSPFGCAFFDSHQSDEEADRKSGRSLMDIASGDSPAAEQYRWLVDHLQSKGLNARDPKASRKALEESYMLAFEPQSLAQMQARYQQALVERVDLMEVKVHVGPQTKREHVFDFHNGLRLIVSIDVIQGRKWVIPLPDGSAARFPTHEALHFSAGTPADSELKDEFERKKKSIGFNAAVDWFCAYAERQFRTLSGHTGELHGLQFSLTPHSAQWFGPWPSST